MHPFFKFIGVTDIGVTTTTIKKEKIVYTDNEIKIMIDEYNSIINNKNPKSDKEKMRYFELRQILKF